MRPDPDYWQALGEFVETFATTEICLFYYLVRTAHLEASIARALFGTDRAESYATRIGRIWQVAPPSESLRQELEPVLNQFHAINSTRNIIIHYASHANYFAEPRTTSEGDQRVTSEGDRRVTRGTVHRISSDIVRAIDPERPRRRTVSAQIVRDMSADLHKIGRHLMSLYAYSKESFDVRADAMPELRNAWRYIPEPAPPPKSHQRQKDKP